MKGKIGGKTFNDKYIITTIILLSDVSRRSFDRRCDCTANQKRVNKYIKFQSTNTEYTKRIDSARNKTQAWINCEFFLLFRESMRWNAVVIFPVSVRIYESLITGPSLHCQPPLLQDKQNDFVYTARHVCAFVQTSNCVSHEGEIDCLTAAA